MTLKLTKMELRAQQVRLAQLQRYLPTLQLKKAMLQAEVYSARHEIAEAEKVVNERQREVDRLAPLLEEPLPFDVRAEVVGVDKRYENIAGVDIPHFEGIEFASLRYSLFDTPAWVDAAIVQLQDLAEAKARVDIAREKAAALEKELREVSLRVNLFEKVLIPRAKENIRRIRVFLGDQELAAVGQAKAAKKKILARQGVRA